MSTVKLSMAEMADLAKAQAGETVPDADNPGWTFTADGQGSYTSYNRGPAKGTADNPSTSVRVGNWQRQTDAQGNTFFSRLDAKGATEYMQADGTGTPLLSQAQLIPKNYSEEKPLTVGNNTYIVRQDPSQQGQTFYKKNDGSFTNNQNDPGVAITHGEQAADKAVDIGAGRKGMAHTDPATGQLVYRAADGSYSSDPTKAQDINTLPAANGAPGKNTPTPYSVGLAQEKAKLQQMQLGTLGDILTGIQGGFLGGRLTKDQAQQQSDMAVQKAVNDYNDSIQKASALNSFNQTQVTQANARMGEANTYLKNSLDTGLSLAAKGPPGAPGASALVGSLLKEGPQFFSSMGAAPANLQSPLSQFVGGGQTPQDPGQTPLTNQSVQGIKAKMAGGMGATQAMVAQAKEEGIDFSSFFNDDGSPVSGTSESGTGATPLSDAGTGASTTRT